MEYLDWRGNEFTIGATVIYPVAGSGSHIKLVEGIIIEIEPINYRTNFGRKQRNFALVIQPIAENYFGKLELRKTKKPVRITAVEKVTVLLYD